MSHPFLSTKINEPKKTENANLEFVAVLLPTYCEANNIEGLIREIENLILKVIIIVIDDYSSDKTPEIVQTLNEEYGNIILISRPTKLGLGTAIIDGFHYALGLEPQPKYVVTMDSDFSHITQDITRLVQTSKNGYNLVIGSRYVKGGRIHNWPLQRKIASYFANILVRNALGLKLRDCTSGFRSYSSKYLSCVLPDLHSTNFEIQIETIRKANLFGFSVKEIPITFLNRKNGVSKLGSRELFSFIIYTTKTTISNLILSFKTFFLR